MKTKKGFELRDVCGEKVIIAKGIENLNFNHLISLNDTAAFLWQAVQGRDSFNEEYLVAKLCEEYEVTKEQAAADVAELVKAWCEQGIVEE